MRIIVAWVCFVALAFGAKKEIIKDVFIADANDGWDGLLELDTSNLVVGVSARTRGDTTPLDDGGAEYVWNGNDWQLVNVVNGEVYDDSAVIGRLDVIEATPDNDTVYDDSAVIGRLDVIEATPDNDTVYDDTAITGRVETLENAPAVEVYDDSAVIGRLDVIEATPDNDTIYDDTALSGRVETLENTLDNDTIYDDTALSGRVETLENAPDNDTIYDDSALTGRVETLENAPAVAVYDDSAVLGRLDVIEATPDNDTIYDDSAIVGRVETLENAPDNDTIYDDSAVIGRLDVIEATPDNDTVYDDTAVIGRLDAVEAESDGFLIINDPNINQTINGSRLTISPRAEFVENVTFTDVEITGVGSKVSRTQEVINIELNSILNAEEGDARYVRIGDAVTSEAVISDTGTLYVLAIGQSNMARGTSEFGQASFDTEVDPLVEVFNTTSNRFEVWDLSLPSQNEYISSSASVGFQSSTIPFHFAKELARKTGRNVRVIASAQGAQGPEYWGASFDGAPHDPTAEGWQRILAQITEVPRIDVILHNQTENNAAESVEDNITAYTQLHTALGTLPQIGSEVVFIAGEGTSETFSGTSNDALLAMEEDPSLPFFYFVPRPETSEVRVGDTIHFDADSIAIYGAKYTHEYLFNTRTGGATIYENDRVAVTTGQKGNFVHAGAFSDPDKQLRFSVSGLGSGQRFNRDFVFELYSETTSITSGTNAKGEFSLSKAGANWSLSQSGHGSKGQGAHITLENETSTSCDVVVRFSDYGTQSGQSFYVSEVKDKPFFDELNRRIDYEQAHVVEDYDGTAVYNTLVEEPVIFIGAQSDGFTTNAFRYFIDISLPSNLRTSFEILGNIGGFGTGNEIFKSTRARILVNKSSDDWSATAVGINAGYGVKVSIENGTNTTARLVVQFVKDTASAINDEALFFFDSGQSESPFADIRQRVLDGEAGFGFSFEAESDPLFEFGGAGDVNF